MLRLYGTNTRRRGPIHRVRTGCLTCRGRKKKCDELKPRCAACARNKLDCSWPDRNRLSRGNGQSNDATLSAEQRYSNHHDPETSPPSTFVDGAFPVDDYSAAVASPETGAISDSPLTQALVLAARQTTPARGMSLFPSLVDPRSFELLGHYLSRTALSMGNGSTDVNPFIAQLIPLTFANGLILQLVLTQSSMHKAVAGDSAQPLAQRDYTKALRSFRDAIDEYVSGRESSPLWVTMGALIMCFTETTKGDRHGVIFDHLSATGPLIANLVLYTSPMLGDDLRAFILEYYIYTALISMISVNPTFRATPFIRPDLEARAQQIADAGYTGHLCGSWLKLLLLIPPIFNLGRRAMTAAHVDKDTELPTFPCADDFITFSTLQARILGYVPHTPPETEVTTCGYIFQHAMHLYLLTAINSGSCGASHFATDGSFQQAIDQALDSAFAYLSCVPSTARINTSLCWPLAVIGSCLPEGSPRRDLLRRHFADMFTTIGLGNIRATATLLEHVWALPENRRRLGPWGICNVMQEHQIWISFA